ncbi:hypothetical protein Afil01_64030 [Actinorhabdospora filicis]|uniref:Uncharacterized protein n=1 Tax=Actinorhabdospora filicis TaxID=1785913 RepID=A0A9W6SVN6_9ACTN|nr:hypothetical protein [Actinorhabdospora filicis]GLZ81596.1 hypothetical protein Afil01_64030 [Actinorhabdospora filicis]
MSKALTRFADRMLSRFVPAGSAAAQECPFVGQWCIVGSGCTATRGQYWQNRYRCSNGTWIYEFDHCAFCR